jgi:hypothetical protein
MQKLDVTKESARLTLPQALKVTNYRTPHSPHACCSQLIDALLNSHEGTGDEAAIKPDMNKILI